MLPPRIKMTFGTVPDELIGLCRSHTWEQLTMPPAEGIRPIRDILAHTVRAEAYWFDHVVKGASRPKADPEDFPSLDAILAIWRPQRDASLAWIDGLTAADRAATRPFPWDQGQRASIEEIVWHVVTHEQYHRGQVFTRLALLGRRDLPDHDLLR
jgi:uncharacterized damage-inducible protein DinB